MTGLDFAQAEAMAGRLHASPGVHRPSPFSMLLASALPPLTALHTIDAGCGAGLVTIAMLAAGAEGVVAQDYDPNAVADTARNVAEVLGPEAAARVERSATDWRELGALRGDLLAVNPPQRPTAVLPAVPAEEVHLHEGGGDDGLDGLRLVLHHTPTDVVLSTASSLLLGDPAEAASALGWRAELVAERLLRHAEPWWVVADSLEAPVHVWRFDRRSPARPR
jgi:methylase of polypeptide subunit release factors